jgi:hypothetical protein
VGIAQRRLMSTPVVVMLLAALVAAATAGDDQTDKRSHKNLKRRLDMLRSVPYTSVTKEQVDSTYMGVVTYKPEKAYPGYGIYTSRLSPEARLIDMEGNIVHRWSYPDEHSQLWDHAIMLDNGDVIVIRKFYDLIRLDWNSNLIWKRPVDSHHEVVFLPDSSIYLVTRELHRHRGLLVRFPSIVRLAPDGQVLERWSTFENLEEIKQKFDQRSFIDTILDSLLADEVDPRTWEPLNAHADSIKDEIDAWPRRYDQFHLNTITILPPNPIESADPRFRQGNLLICFRNVNQIAVLDRVTKEILWVWGQGNLDWPHHPTMVESGNILIFDNGTHRGYSRLIELNPLTERIEWEYVGDPPEAFFTPEKGSAQRLPNGNTLVCEGDKGRAFEITRQGEIVWEWYNRALKDGRREQIYRMMRLEPDIVKPLLK